MNQIEAADSQGLSDLLLFAALREQLLHPFWIRLRAARSPAGVHALFLSRLDLVHALRYTRR